MLSPPGRLTYPILGEVLNGLNTAYLDYDNNAGALRVSFSQQNWEETYTLMFLAKYIKTTNTSFLPYRAKTGDGETYSYLVMGANNGNYWKYTHYAWSAYLLDSDGHLYWHDPSGEWSIYSITVESQTSLVCVQENGVQIVSAIVPSTGTIQAFELGTAVSRSPAHYAETLGWGKVLSEAEILSAVLYLKTKYGLI